MNDPYTFPFNLVPKKILFFEVDKIFFSEKIYSSLGENNEKLALLFSFIESNWTPKRFLGLIDRHFWIVSRSMIVFSELKALSKPMVPLLKSEFFGEHFHVSYLVKPSLLCVYKY